MKKRIAGRLISVFLSMLVFVMPMVCGAGEPPAAAAAKMTLEDLQTKFPGGRYWNHLAGKNHKYTGTTHSGQCGDILNTTTTHPCNKHGDDKVSRQGDYSCNCYNQRTQCCGFATYLGKLTFGTDPYNWSTTTGKSTAMSVVKPGDIIHYYGAGAGARLALRRSVYLEKYAEGSREYLACDVDFDGIISAADARLILRASVGFEKPENRKK